MDNKIMNDNRYSLLMQLFFFESLVKWKHMPSTRLIHHLPDNIVKTKNTLLRNMVTYANRSLITQYFVYLYELLDGNFDESLKNNKNEFSKMKFKIDTNGNLKSVNAKQLLDIIRQSFAHNNDSNPIPNWQWDKGNNIIIHKKQKNNTIEFKIHIIDLLNLANLYINNHIDNPRTAVGISAVKLYNAIKQNRLNVSNIHKYVDALDNKTKTHLPLDKQQKNALYNFFVKMSNGLTDTMIKHGIHPYKASFLSTKYPFKCNACNNAINTQIVLEMISLLDNPNYTRNEFLRYVCDKKVMKEKSLDVAELEDYLGRAERFEACIASNILFNIFAYMDPLEIQQYLKNREDLNFNKVRNAIMHGRFYYNYGIGFNFYDGRINKKDKEKSLAELEKDITYVGTLTMIDIVNLTRNLLNDYADTYVFDDNKKRSN